MKGQALGPMKRREERKKAQPAEIRRSKGVQWKELVWDTQRLPGDRDHGDMQHS